MMVVLVIIGLLAGLIVVRGPERSGAIDMRQAASLVTSGLRVARSQAIARNRPVPVRFQADALQIGDEAAKRLPPGIRLVSAAPTILFRPDGSSTGGEIQLASGSRTTAIGVDWLTGRVTKNP